MMQENQLEFWDPKTLAINKANEKARPLLLDLCKIEKVKVFSYEYTVKWVNKNLDETEDAWGWCDFQERSINISVEALSIPERAVEIFLHEWIHAGHDFFDLDDNSTEEKFTTLTSRLLIEYIRTNPEVFELINKIIHKTV